MELMNNMRWKITEPFESIRLLQNNNLIPIPTNIFNLKLPIQIGDRVTLLFDIHGEAALTAPIIGNTIGEFLQSLYRSLITPIDVDSNNQEIQNILNCINHMPNSWKKHQYLYKIAYNTLTPLYLLQTGNNGDHVFFEGNLRRNNGIWTYSTGS